MLNNLQRLLVLISDNVLTYQLPYLRTLKQHQLDRTLQVALTTRVT